MMFITEMGNGESNPASVNERGIYMTGPRPSYRPRLFLLNAKCKNVNRHFSVPVN